LLSRIVKKYEKLRKDLPKENGEVKGRLLTEKQVERIVTLLARNEAVFEVTALDLGLHKEVAARDYQRKLGEGMLAKVLNF
jgi:CRISPR/Cas system-associated protein endoribonuclease Cas2